MEVMEADEEEDMDQEVMEAFTEDQEDQYMDHHHLYGVVIP